LLCSRCINFLAQTVAVLLRQGLGRGKIGRIVNAHTAKIKSEAAQAAADRDPDNAEAQAKASRVKREAIDRERVVDDPQYAQSSRLPSANSPLTPTRKLIHAGECFANHIYDVRGDKYTRAMCLIPAQAPQGGI
jgi:hypothetical protein